MVEFSRKTDTGSLPRPEIPLPHIIGGIETRGFAGITARYFICYRLFGDFLPSALLPWGLTALVSLIMGLQTTSLVPFGVCR